MPIYEYQCEKCKARFEEIVIGKGGDEVCCPECGHDRTRRLMSTFSWSGTDGARAASACSSCAPSPGACKHCSSK